jgi:beta-phosphoglucomutase-like phosphatase (HAD superfamily)
LARESACSAIRTTAALQSELRAVCGIETALDELDVRRVRYCVASSGTHEKMRTTLGITGLLPRLEGRMYIVTDVARGKPAPDVYLYAADQNGAAPAACCVIEDSPTGVTAGVAAGMTVPRCYSTRNLLKTGGLYLF